MRVQNSQLETGKGGTKIDEKEGHASRDTEVRQVFHPWRETQLWHEINETKQGKKCHTKMPPRNEKIKREKKKERKTKKNFEVTALQSVKWEKERDGQKLEENVKNFGLWFYGMRQALRQRIWNGIKEKRKLDENVKPKKKRVNVWFLFKKDF